MRSKAAPLQAVGNRTSHKRATLFEEEDENEGRHPIDSLGHLRYLQRMRLLALDPALRSSGFAILEKREQKIRSLAYGVIQIRADVPMAQCLVEIHRQVSQLIDRHQPEACAVESVIFVQNSRTAVTLGAARGSALLAAAQRGLNIFEYPPKRVKQAIVGTGAAQKSQVGFMVRALLGLTENPESDAADALAIGLTHLQMQDSPLRLFQATRRL
jgi:crossover junction endodeoxyribonuclease RuvC